MVSGVFALHMIGGIAFLGFFNFIFSTNLVNINFVLCSFFTVRETNLCINYILNLDLVLVFYIYFEYC